MDIGTGLTLLGIWVFAGSCAISKNITGEFCNVAYWSAMILTIGFTILTAVNFGRI